MRNRGRLSRPLLGTSVLVLPWYHPPLRLAEEIAMLNGRTRGTLCISEHRGAGGTARMEYDRLQRRHERGPARASRNAIASGEGKVGRGPSPIDGPFWNGFERRFRIRPEAGGQEDRSTAPSAVRAVPKDGRIWRGADSASRPFPDKCW